MIKVDTPEALTTAMLEAFSCPNGGGCDWERIESLIYPGCHFGIVSREQGFQSLSFEELKNYVNENIGDTFLEYELGHETTNYGDITHIWSCSVSKVGEDVEFRAVNSYQIIKENGRYRLQSLVFQIETADEPIPEHLVS